MFWALRIIWSLLELFSSVLAVIEVLKTQIWAQLRSNRAVFVNTESWILYCFPICTIYYCSVGIYQPFKNGHEIVLALHLVQVLRVMKTRLSSGDGDLAFWIPMFPGRGAVVFLCLFFLLLLPDWLPNITETSLTISDYFLRKRAGQRPQWAQNPLRASSELHLSDVSSCVRTVSLSYFSRKLMWGHWLSPHPLHRIGWLSAQIPGRPFWLLGGGALECLDIG